MRNGGDASCARVQNMELTGASSFTGVPGEECQLICVLAPHSNVPGNTSTPSREHLRRPVCGQIQHDQSRAVLETQSSFGLPGTGLVLGPLLQGRQVTVILRNAEALKLATDQPLALPPSGRFIANSLPGCGTDALAAWLSATSTDATLPFQLVCQARR